MFYVSVGNELNFVMLPSEAPFHEEQIPFNFV